MNPTIMLAAETPAPALSAENIASATSNIFSVVGDTLNEIVTQPVFLMFFVSGLIFLSIRIIEGLKRA